MFKVEADQIQASDGWVRCGHCDGVFDASAHFQPLEQLPELQRVFVPAPPPAPQPTQPTAQAPVAQLVSEQDDAPALELPSLLSMPSPETAASSPQVADTAVSASLSSYLSTPTPADSQETPVTAVSPDVHGVARSVRGQDLPGVAKAKELRRQPPQDLGFVRTARNRARRARPLYRFLSVLLLLVLAMALLLQMVWRDHDALASRYPSWLPVLESLCEKMGCRIQPPRVIEAVVIDSSSFSQTGAASYQVSFVLKNTGSGPVAMPFLEVTLTGAQDQVLVRKVLRPIDWGTTSDRLGAAASLAGAFTVQSVLAAEGAAPVSVSTEGESPAQPPVAQFPPELPPVTGYRLLAFYP
jgi:predicted Zn finger-like uncharacterized protein